MQYVVVSDMNYNLEEIDDEDSYSDLDVRLDSVFDRNTF